nr:reverse transcriptase domain-containing protein [Tanacetum cinerariifolium]
TFQRCMMAIFHDMIEKTMEVFMDDFLVFGNSFQSCLSHLEMMLKRCEDTNLCLNWEKSHFMVKEVNYNQGNTSYRPPMMSNQIRPPGFPPVPNNQNVQLNYRNNQNRFNENQNRGNNFNQGPVYQPSVFQPPAYQAPAYQAPAPQTQCVSMEDFSAYVKANDENIRNIQTQGQNMQNQLTNLTELLTKFVKSSSASTSSLEAIKDTVTPPNNESTEDVQPPVVPTKSLILTSEPVNSLTIEPVASPVSSPRPNQRPSIPYPSRLQDQKLRDKANDQPDFVVVDFDADPRVPLILGRSFLKTGKALIDVFEGELTFRVGKKAITFNLDLTSRYLANYNDMTAKRIDVIDIACEEYSQEFLGFSDVIASGNPTPYYDLIISTTSPTLTPFENSDFLLEEVDAFLALEDDPTSSKVDQSYLDFEGTYFS